MDPVRYPCSYEGGFKGMRSHPDAVLELTDEQFSVSRPKTLWAKTYRIWAKWTAVTGLTVSDLAEADGTDPGAAAASEPDAEAEDGADFEGDGPSARVALTTRARGTGVLVVPSTSADELWEAFHGIADLAERFPRPTADEQVDGDGDEPGEGGPAAEG